MDISKYSRIYFVGLKGSGMCALALLLQKLGYEIEGSDVQDTFYTDQILSDAGLLCHQGFDSSHISRDMEAVVYSAAYSVDNNEEMKRITELGIPCFVYPEALGSISKQMTSCAIIGTHGKTSSTAFVGTICKALKLSVMSLTGGKVVDWDNNTFWYGGKEGFFAEVCEYRNHFEHFDANFAMLTSAELDHPDYFENADAVYNSFHGFLERMVDGSTSPKETPKDMLAKKCIIAYGDSDGVRASIGQDLEAHAVFYGKESENDVRVSIDQGIGEQRFEIFGLDEIADNLQWTLPVPGEALVLDVVGALLLIREWAREKHLMDTIHWKRARDALAQFKGISRRSEVLYKDEHYVVIDDYGHHPTAIAMTLQGIRDFYAPKRLIVDFMPHTYSRTNALLDEFSQSFSAADIVVCNDIYSSAREQIEGVTGEDFVEEVKKHHDSVLYMPNFDDAKKRIYDLLQEGDVLVSMGAGDNFRITHEIADRLRKDQVRRKIAGDKDE